MVKPRTGEKAVMILPDVITVKVGPCLSDLQDDMNFTRNFIAQLTAPIPATASVPADNPIPVTEIAGGVVEIARVSWR
jgi:hypothetical protein